jgi:biopolymer transport protein ExbB
MIRAFQGLVEAGGRPDPSILAGGISTALVTTLWGLVVAIPALACYSVIRNKIDAITGDVILLAEDLLRPFKPGGKRTSASGGGDGGEKASRPRATPQPGDGS